MSYIVKGQHGADFSYNGATWSFTVGLDSRFRGNDIRKIK